MGISDDTERRVVQYGTWLEQVAAELKESSEKYRTLRSACLEFVSHESPPIPKPPDLEVPGSAASIAPSIQPIVPQSIRLPPIIIGTASPSEMDPFDRVDRALRAIAAAAGGATE